MDISPHELQDIIVRGGIGMFAGFVLGYTIKKFLKIVLIIIGGLLGVLLWAQQQGMVTVNWTRVEQWLNQTATTIIGVTGSLANTVPLAGFAFGLGLGLAKG